MIEVSNLTKMYGSKLAVNNISFTVNDGEIVGFLGPNGAGKTTTMNILTGYISATSGSVSINGHNIFTEPEKAKKEIGYLPDTPPIYSDMKVHEYLTFAAEIKGVPKNRRNEAINEVMESVNIKDVSNKLIKNLSRGYKQRVGLAQALINKPKVLILDEPTIGLDPKQIIEVRNIIKSLGGEHTVILSSHILSEVSAVCDRVMIIDKGNIVASDSAEKLSLSLTGHKLITRIKATEEQIETLFKDKPLIAYASVEASREEGTFDVILEGENGADIRETVFHLASEFGLPILMLKSVDMSLEDIFLQLTSDDNAQTYADNVENNAIEEVNADDGNN